MSGRSQRRAALSPAQRLNTSSVSVDDVRDASRYKVCLAKIAKVMDVVQSDEYGMGGKKGKRCEKLGAKVLNQMEKIFNESGLKVFSETLMRMMIVPFQAKDSDPFASRINEFFFELLQDGRWIGEGFTNSQDLNGTMNSTMNSTLMEDGSEPLPLRVLKLCERYHQDNRAIVRLRLMQTVEKIIPDVIETRKLGRPLQLKLIRMLHTRRKDKNDQVRALALRNLCQFYKEGLPFQAQVEDELLHHMSYDPEPSVRLKIVKNITIFDNILEVFAERTGDPNDSVRAAAIDRIAKDVPVKKLPLQLREIILSANTTEDNPKIIQNALNGMLKEWLKCFENDPCEFLRILNVRRRLKLCRSALDTLYSESSETAFEKMSQPLLSDKNYPEDSLCVESTFLWLYMYTRFQNEPYIMKKLTLPVDEMIEYIHEFVDVVEEEGNLSAGDLAYRSWMLGDMLQILCFLPVEEGERKAILTFLLKLFVKKKLMDTRNSRLGVKLISICSDIQEETQLIDLVNTVLDSDRDAMRKSSSRSKTPTEQVEKVEVVGQDDMDTGENVINWKRELGNVTHRRRKLERDRDLAVMEDDLNKAQVLQDEIKKLEEEGDQIKAKITMQESLEQSQDLSNRSIAEMEADEPWPYTDSTMLISLTMVKENIELLNKVSSFSRQFYDMYAVRAVAKCRDPAVRALALELMCVMALEHEMEASRATLYCLMALLKDSLPVKTSALKGLFDLVMKYSFVKLGATKEVQSVLLGLNSMKDTDIPKLRVDNEDLATTLKTLLLSYIRHDEVALVKVSVAGALKLLFKREINFSRIVTSFLTHWAIPSHETRVRFKDVGVMVPVYATVGENEAIEVARCLLNCIKKTLIKMHSGALGEDQLPHPELDQIISLIVKGTHPSKLANFERPYIGHQTIALGALEELRDPDLITEEKLQYAKLLKVLEIKDCPVEAIKQMIHSITEIAADTNKRISTILSGFSKHLESLITDGGDGDGGDGNGAEQNELENEDDAPAGAFDDDETASNV